MVGPTPNELRDWMEPLVGLTLGPMVLVILAVILARVVRSGIWRRAIWQVVTIVLLLLFVAEFTGMARGTVEIGYSMVQHGFASQPENPTELRESKRDLPESQLVDRQPGIGHHEPKGNELVEIDVQPLTDPPRGPELIEALPGRHLPYDSVDDGAQPVEHEFEFTPSADVESQAAVPTAPASSEFDTNSAVVWLGLIWLLGALVVLFRAIWSRVKLRRFVRRQTRDGGDRYRVLVTELCRRMGIRRPIRLLESDHLSTPVVLGAIRPAIILPATFPTDFGIRQQHAILAHELAHVAAADGAWQFAAALSTSLLWFHPAAWWSRLALRDASELAADEASALIPGGAELLAESLVALGRKITDQRQFAWLAMAGSGFRSSLGRRVERLLSSGSSRRPRFKPRLLAKTALVVSFTLLALSCTAWARPQASPSRKGHPMNLLTNSWQRSLAATAVLSFLGPMSADGLADERDREVLLALQDDRAEDERREVRERREIEERERDFRERQLRERRETRERAERERGGEPRRVDGRPDHDRMERLREVIQNRIREISQALERSGEAPESKRRELAQGLEQAKRQLENFDKERRSGDTAGRRRPEFRNDGERRMHHLHVAIENLKAAGLHDQAAQLARQAEEIERDLNRESRGREHDDRAHDHHDPADHRHEHGEHHHAEGHPPRNLEGAVAELHEQMDHMRRQMAEMRQALKELLEDREEEDDDGDDDDEFEDDNDG